MAPSLVGFALMACFLGLGPQCRHWVEWHLTQKGHLAREGKFEGTGKGGRRGRAASPSAVSWWACFYYSLFCVYLGRKQLSEPLTALVEGSSEQELGAGDWGARINAVGPQASHSMSLPLSSWAVEVGDFKSPFLSTAPCMCQMSTWQSWIWLSSLWFAWNNVMEICSKFIVFV